MRKLRDLPANHTAAPRYFDRGGRDVIAELLEEMLDEVDTMQRAEEAATEAAITASAPAHSGLRSSRRRLIPRIPSGLTGNTQPEVRGTEVTDQAIVVAAGSLAVENVPPDTSAELPPDHLEGDLRAFIGLLDGTDVVTYVPGTPIDQALLQQV